jgi:hypothetical protein
MRGHNNPAARSDPTAAPVASHPSRTVGFDGPAESVYDEVARILIGEAERQERQAAKSA